MNPKYQPYEQIDRYLNHELSEEEKVQFDQNLLTDESFQAVFEAQKKAHEVLIDHELIKLRARMSKDLDAMDNGSSSNWGKIVLLSAAIGIGSVGLYSYFQSNSTSPAETIQQETKPLPQDQEQKISPSANKDNTTTIVSPTKKKTLPNGAVQENNPVRSENKNSTEVPLIENQMVTPPIVPAEKQEVVKENKVLSEQKNNPVSKTHKEVENRKEDAPKELKEENTNVKAIDDIFAPSMGEVWHLPIENGKDAQLKIFNKAGAPVYESSISGGYPNEWNGRDLNGNELMAGNYYFIISFADGKLLKGHVSIVQ